MIKLINHKNINKQKWDDCVSESLNPSIFVCSWYLDIVCDDWCALVLNDYEAIFPLAIKSKYKIQVIYQPFFTRYFGLYSKNKISEKMVNEFLNAIPSKFKHIEFNLHENNHFENKIFEVQERKFQILNLNTGYDDLFKHYSENAKRNLKKSKKVELAVSEGVCSKEIVNLFKHAKGKELEVFKTSDYEKLMTLMENCERRKCAESYSVHDSENNLVGAAFFIRNGNHYTYLKSGLTEKGKSFGAMHLIMDSFIKKHSNTMSILDFGGSSVESVARFYKNFGAKDCVYLQVKRDNLPQIIKWVKKIKR